MEELTFKYFTTNYFLEENKNFNIKILEAKLRIC